MSLQELLEIEVTTVSRVPEPAGSRGGGGTVATGLAHHHVRRQSESDSEDRFEITASRINRRAVNMCVRALARSLR